MSWLDADAVLTAPPPPRGAIVGRSREGRPIAAWQLGSGSRRVSLVAGAHADEPVGPAMLAKLVGWLGTLPSDAPPLRAATWFVVPHVNPDGAARNAVWAAPYLRSGGEGAATELFAAYVRGVVREPPGDDIEFGYPRADDDAGARPENHAVAGFLRDGAPLALHGSFHGMGFAAGPWFLMERSWADRTPAMRDRLRARVRELGYALHDVDRRGEKGFHRIDEGFTSRPDSGAMAAHFQAAGEPITAALFRPSSMELARRLGGDPLTIVSEMPLFILPSEVWKGPEIVRPPVVEALRRLAAAGDETALRTEAERVGLRAMPVADQMRLQLAFLGESLRAIGVDA